MTQDSALEILEAVDSDLKGAQSLERLQRHMLDAAINYARIRTDWSMATIEERVAMDQRRHATHNALIVACNILSRGMLKQGKPITWRQTLGQDRKEIGDFACHVHCLLGMRAR